jgi:hypothetical protein
MMNWIGSSKDNDYEEKNRVSSFRGYLLKMKRSHNLLAPQWGKRWFSIEGRYLRWYRQDTDISPSGFVDLRHVRSITKVDINGAFTFCVTSEDRNLIMRASSVAEMNGWIRALHMQADIARGGSGMTVVSDFNEIPLSQAAINQKKARGRGSLTLEQQLDLNLKKLTELEQELFTPTDHVSQNSSIYGRSPEMKSHDEDVFNTEDSVSDMQYLSPTTQGHRSKAGLLRNSNQNRNPLAEAPSSQQQYRQSQPSRSGAIHHTDSADSLDTPPARSGPRSSHDIRENSNNNTSAGEYTAKMAAQYPGGGRNDAAARTRSGSELNSNENSGDDRSVNSEYDLPDGNVRKVPIHTGKHMPKGASIYSNPGAVKASQGHTSKPRGKQNALDLLSAESMDSMEFTYIPDISDENASYSPEVHGKSLGGGGRGGAYHVGKGNTNGARSAWV